MEQTFKSHEILQSFRLLKNAMLKEVGKRRKVEGAVLLSEREVIFNAGLDEAIQIIQQYEI